MTDKPARILSLTALALIMISCGNGDIAEYTDPEQIVACSSINSTLDTVLAQEKNNKRLLHAMMVESTQHDCVNELDRIIQTGIDVNYISGSQSILDVAERVNATLSLSYLLDNGVIAAYREAQSIRVKQLKSDKEEKRLAAVNDKPPIKSESNNKSDKFIRLKNLAGQGDTKAQFDIAIVYLDGDGISQDHNKAFIWLRKAAKQGYAPAQYNVGALYDQGIGVQKDSNEAVMWFQTAAEQGYVDAQFNLAQMYYDGDTVEKDINKALMWFRKAAAQGDTEAREWANRISSVIAKIENDGNESERVYNLAESD